MLWVLSSDKTSKYFRLCNNRWNSFEWNAVILYVKFLSASFSQIRKRKFWIFESSLWHTSLVAYIVVSKKQNMYNTPISFIIFLIFFHFHIIFQLSLNICKNLCLSMCSSWKIWVKLKKCVRVLGEKWG